MLSSVSSVILSSKKYLEEANSTDILYFTYCNYDRYEVEVESVELLFALPLLHITLILVTIYIIMFRRILSNALGPAIRARSISNLGLVGLGHMGSKLVLYHCLYYSFLF
jgi:hypothetical protein